MESTNKLHYADCIAGISNIRINHTQLPDISPALFTAAYLSQISKRVGENLSQNIDPLILFTNYIQLPPSAKLLVAATDPDQFITDMFANPYLAKKTYRLKLSISDIDTILTRLVSDPTTVPNDPRRVKFILYKVCKNEYVSYGKLIASVSNFSITDMTLVTSLVHKLDDSHYISEECYTMEKYIIDLFNKMHASPVQFTPTLPTAPLIKLDTIQTTILTSALEHNISIIAGKPGTGKSELIGALLELIPNTLVLAPTGCAVDNIQRRFPTYQARVHTLHAFYYTSAKYPAIMKFLTLPKKCIIIDEFSMVSVNILYKVMTKFAEPPKLILVGDHNQLPSMGLGQMLRDFIAQKIYNVHQLEKSYRSNNGIVDVLEHILTHKKLALNKSMKHITIQEPKDICPHIALLDPAASRISPFGFFRSVDNIILAPTNVEANKYNEFIQKYNPIKAFPGVFPSLKHDDKVIFLKNKPDFDLYNGTILHVDNIYVAKGSTDITITFQNGKKFTCKPIELSDHVKLSYAITIHKAQSAGFKNVFVMMNRYPTIMHDIKLIYTAISRAKDMCFISGLPSQINASCKVNTQKITSIPLLIEQYVEATSQSSEL